MKKFSDEELELIANELYDNSYSILPTIDGGGCVTEKQIEDTNISAMNTILKIPTLNEESQSFIIQLRDYIRRTSIC